jgi:hypothetical protein
MSCGWFLRTGLELIIIGLVIGLAASLGLTRLIKDERWGVSEFDPATFGSVACVLGRGGCRSLLISSQTDNEGRPAGCVAV